MVIMGNKEICGMAFNPRPTTSRHGGYMTSTNHKYNRPMSVEDYLKLDDAEAYGKWQYIDGVAKFMSGGTVAHDRLMRNVSGALDAKLGVGPCTAFGSEVRTLVGRKNNNKEQYY